MGGCGEANNGSGTAGDWAVAVNEKANVKTRPHEKTIVANLKQFLMPMGITFRAGQPCWHPRKTQLRITATAEPVNPVNHVFILETCPRREIRWERVHRKMSGERCSRCAKSKRALSSKDLPSTFRNC